MDSPGGTSHGRRNGHHSCLPFIPPTSTTSTKKRFHPPSTRFFWLQIFIRCVIDHLGFFINCHFKSLQIIQLNIHPRMPPRAPLCTGQLHHEPENTNDVFDPPNLTTDGDDAPARHPTLQRLWSQGTEKRRLMEEGQSFTVAVQFKIHTNNRVDVPPAHPNPVPKLTTRKKEAPPVPTFAVIDSSTFKNNRVLESRAVLYGKSLNKFKDLIGDICDEYKKGTKKVVLDSPLLPLLTWNATVGLKKLHLVDYQSYQQFVDNLGKSRTRKGVINITLENPQAKAKQDAQASGGVAYIKGLNGPSSIEEELVASKEETAAARQETMYRKPKDH
ncbi:hypothetical protein DFH28DRAFT_1080819 [Melampsora americana]|nr:hypothetical protein DFH28DRAFT_1080819 [Melampsora americana]